MREQHRPRREVRPGRRVAQGRDRSNGSGKQHDSPRVSRLPEEIDRGWRRRTVCRCRISPQWGTLRSYRENTRRGTVAGRQSGLREYRQLRCAAADAHGVKKLQNNRTETAWSQPSGCFVSRGATLNRSCDSCSKVPVRAFSNLFGLSKAFRRAGSAPFTTSVRTALQSPRAEPRGSEIDVVEFGSSEQRATSRRRRRRACRHVNTAGRRK